MPAFRIQEAFGSSAVSFGGNYRSIEIALEQPKGLSRQHGETSILTAPLTSDQEIDRAIDALKSELEGMREPAKRKLKSFS
jgi:hypothetical protein